MNKKIHGRENDTVAVVDSVPKSEVAKREEAMQAFWVEHDIFKKSIETPAGATPTGDFIFYDGPPFATGLPHYGHILAGTIKDAIPRFWTMNGKRVQRNWGWDCHGLPVENIIEKKLGLGTKKDIEDFGIQKFNESARHAVMEYADDWRKIIPRTGRFINMTDDYKTMDSTYTESVWWVFKSLHEKGLVYEGFKSMHLCPRCGTTLSNFEVNQGYKDIKDLSVFVELPLLEEENTSLLIWTTTPWTLPGNMAAAIHNDYEYATVEVSAEDGTKKVIIAKDRVVGVLKDREYKILETRKGSELVGKSYQPPFAYLSNQDFQGKENAWKIHHADYVEIGEEGTGAVHIAPAYGDDDMRLAQDNNVPIMHHVDDTGHFMDFVTDFAGLLVKPKDDADAEINHMDTDIEIIRALAARGVLFGKEKITHSYPHCWRCETPLLNYATTSWFVEVTKIKDQLVEANTKVKWVPEHVGTNRFGKWLEGARDWAVSRQRYWGAPLPIWTNPVTGDHHVCGSLADVQALVPKSGNEYIIMRHGESESNVKEVVSCNKKNNDSLTEKGLKQVVATTDNLQDIEVIIHSGFERTKQTAETVAKKFPDAELIEDDRIRELDLTDDYEGKDWSAYNANFSSWGERFEKKLEGSENRRDVQIRMGDFIYDLETTYAGKKILIISHGGPLFALECASQGLTVEESELRRDGSGYLNNAEVRPLPFTPMPHNDAYELDFHRPYIDNIDLYEGDTKLERVPDVFDCWFESGSMPYAQHHHPFSTSDDFAQTKFPAQFIAEGVDQTRGWFYSLIVIGTALFGKAPFENVVVNGTVLAEDGAKMSKSLQNYPDPMDVANTAGADAMRFYLLSSPGIKGEDFSFLEKEVLEIQRKNIGRLHNVLAMYQMFANETQASADSTNVLDRWIIARLHILVAEMTAGYTNYELDKATRPVTDFIDDLSVWYLRRSRDRFKGDDAQSRDQAIATLRYTLQTLALGIAPVMPFYAEYLWQAVKADDGAQSVHLGKWPVAGAIDEAILPAMEQTRDIVTAALEARTKSGIKVRQPIAAVFGPAIPTEMVHVVLEELNAKAYEVSEVAISIDTKLTPELLSEGAVRDLMRAIQGKRKTEGLAPQDEIILQIHTDANGQEALATHQELLMKTVGATRLEYVVAATEAVQAGTLDFSFDISLV